MVKRSLIGGWGLGRRVGVHDSRLLIGFCGDSIIGKGRKNRVLSHSLTDPVYNNLIQSNPSKVKTSSKYVRKSQRMQRKMNCV